MNGALTLETQLLAEDLLSQLHEVEAEFGRLRTSRWGARTLDLDVLFCGENVLPSPEIWRKWHDLPADQQILSAPDQLILPHPRLQDRGFVLVPVADVAPDWVHPLLNKTIRELCDALPENLKNEVKPL